MATITFDHTQRVGPASEPMTSVFKRVIARMIDARQRTAQAQVDLYLRKLDAETLQRLGRGEAEIAELVTRTSRPVG